MYRVQLLPRAARELRKLPRSVQTAVKGKLEALAADPYPPGRGKLKGRREPTWRVRSGNYRILYQVQQDELIVLVVRVVDRKEAY